MQVPMQGPILRALLVGGALCALLSAAGCASNDADFGATYDPITEFPATASWVWDDSANRLPDDDRLDTAEIDQDIKSVVGSEFGTRGYTEAPSGDVQYLLSYELGVYTWLSQTEARAFGTLSVLMSEAATGRRVWLGFLRLQIDHSLTAEQREERLHESVAGMLENFPPGQPGR
jgi:hypothetical protein